MKILIKNGRVINPLTGLNDIRDILVEDSKVAKIDKEIIENVDQVIEAKDYIVVPGLIDAHVHLRDPGYTYKETIETGTQSAAKGGFTTVCPMPNTNPVTDNVNTVEFVVQKAVKESSINVLPVGAITKGQEGKELADFEGMKAAGIIAVSEDGKTVQDIDLFKEAMLKAKSLDIPVLSHCEDEALAGGCMNEGEVSRQLGLKGVPNAAEDNITKRDIEVSEAIDSKIHLCHVSTKGSIEIIREAKERGAKVTCEVCPHHFTLTEEAVTGDNPNTKMSPPLRTREDVDAIIKAFEDGIVDMIATDHAPHSADEKAKSYEEAPNGIVGFETALPLAVTFLLNNGIITEERLVELMSVNPAKMLGIDRGNIAPGNIADITIIDLNDSYAIDAEQLVSKSKNTPFDGMYVKGRVKYTFVNGHIVYSQL